MYTEYYKKVRAWHTQQQQAEEDDDEKLCIPLHAKCMKRASCEKDYRESIFKFFSLRAHI